MIREILALVAAILLLPFIVGGACEQACRSYLPADHCEYRACHWGPTVALNIDKLICTDCLVLAPKETLSAFNHPPIAAAVSAVTDENASINIDVLVQSSDQDNDALAVIFVSMPSHGTAAINADRTITYTPALAYCGPDSFTYTISDGQATATATAIISVNCAIATVSCWTITVKEIDDCIQGLSDGAFKPPASEQKKAFTDKLNPIGRQIADKNYLDAMDQLQDDVRVRTDGYLGGSPEDDWITDSNAQIQVCGMIDELIANLEIQSAPPRVYPG